MPGRVVDVGCGPGNSTELLSERWPEADIVGIDTSETMLAEARKRLPKARFEQADAATWLPERGTGVVFANAVYQWIPGHKEQFARIVEQLEPGGVLAVQMPDNLMEPLHVLMREVAARPAFVKKLAGAPRGPLPKVGALLRRADAPRPAGRHLAHGLQPRDGGRLGDRRMDQGNRAQPVPPAARCRPSRQSSSRPIRPRSRRPIRDRRTGRC